jgi:hypothetical protein
MLVAVGLAAELTGSDALAGTSTGKVSYFLASRSGLIFSIEGLEPQNPTRNTTERYTVEEANEVVSYPILQMLNTAIANGLDVQVVIIDAYDNPYAAADLQAFSTQFGLPNITASNFNVVYAIWTQPQVN